MSTPGAVTRHRARRGSGVAAERMGPPMAVLNTEDPAQADAARRLEIEPIIWLTTVTAAGQPQSTPVWFLWDGAELVIYGAKNGAKQRNIAVNPRVCLHLEGDHKGGAIVILDGTARIDTDGRRADEHPEYLAKYGGFIESYGWTPSSFAADYPHLIRVTPTRVRAW
jgi:PPOX class probable F420-dependent enzyme